MTNIITENHTLFTCDHKFTLWSQQNKPVIPRSWGHFLMFTVKQNKKNDIHPCPVWMPVETGGVKCKTTKCIIKQQMSLIQCLSVVNVAQNIASNKIEKY